MNNSWSWVLAVPVIVAFTVTFLCEFTGKRIEDNKIILYPLAVALFGPWLVVSLIAHISVRKFVFIGILVMLLAATIGAWVAKALKWVLKK